MRITPHSNPLALIGVAEDRKTPRILEIDDVAANDGELRLWMHPEQSDGWVTYLSDADLRTWLRTGVAASPINGMSPNRRTPRVLDLRQDPGDAATLLLSMHPPGKARSGLALYAKRAEVEAWMDRAAQALELASQPTTPGLSHLRLENFALFQELTWERHGAINVIVGRNDTGKSHLLKILYCLAKSFEGLEGKSLPLSPTDLHVILFEKIRGAFQPDNLAQLIQVTKKRAELQATVHGQRCRLRLYGTTSRVSMMDRGAKLSEASAIFIPPKELLTAFDAIVATRERLEIDGFDDTYYDLIRALRLPPTRGKINPALTQVLESLQSLLGGVITMSEGSGRFVFQRGDHSFLMPQTAEGIKKLGILTSLIHNRILRPGSILFMDEPETNLHPAYITALMVMLMDLATAGVQVYLATHSYFVIKQLHILAKERQKTVVFCSLTREGDAAQASFADLQDGMPDNPIIAEAVSLYEREVAVDLKR